MDSSVDAWLVRLQIVWTATSLSHFPRGGLAAILDARRMVSMLNIVYRELLIPVIGNVLECVGLLSKTIGAGILAVEMY